MLEKRCKAAIDFFMRREGAAAAMRDDPTQAVKITIICNVDRYATLC